MCCSDPPLVTRASLPPTPRPPSISPTVLVLEFRISPKIVGGARGRSPGAPTRHTPSVFVPPCYTCVSQRFYIHRGKLANKNTKVFQVIRDRSGVEFKVSYWGSCAVKILSNSLNVFLRHNTFMLLATTNRPAS